MTPASHPEPPRPIQSLMRHIQSTRKERTVLLTDIEDSTQFWRRHGDVAGRLMIDRHNWLLFPVVRHFKGRIVKTIGDSILALFKSPDQALRASIAMQQILERERKTDPDFGIKIRIALHSGQTLVENNDVFGDVVNVASRLENRAKGGEILLSADTRKLLKPKTAVLEVKESFVPKGTTHTITIFRCQWRQSPDLSAPIRRSKKLPLIPRQRASIFLYAVSSLAVLYLLSHLYIRFFLSENETLALLLINSENTPWQYALGALAGLGMLGFIYFIFFKLKTIPVVVLRIFKGGFGFLLAFTLAYLILSIIPSGWGRHLNTPQFTSHHLFVKTLLPDNPIYRTPEMHAEIIRHSPSGRLWLLTDVKKNHRMIWNKILLASNQHGWIPRIIPPDIGVPERRVTLTNRFFFRNLDIYALLTGLLGFLWGYYTFHIRPA